VAVVKKPGSEVPRDELLAFYQGKTAKWQIPDALRMLNVPPALRLHASYLSGRLARESGHPSRPD
jgi:hypothetical protein